MFNDQNFTANLVFPMVVKLYVKTATAYAQNTRCNYENSSAFSLCLFMF